MNIRYYLLALLVASCAACNQPDDKRSGLIRVDLEPQYPMKGEGLRWSPKGKKLSLKSSSEGLETQLFLGPKGLRPINLRLFASEKGRHYDKLAMDLDRDGLFGEAPDTILSCTPGESRGKIWSSFSAVVTIPFGGSQPGDSIINPYPLSLWYVLDPAEPAVDQVIRYSRRGWMEGMVESDRGSFRVLITESMMDGIFDDNDSWAIAFDSLRTAMFQSKSAKSISQHNWLGEQAYGIDSLVTSGRELWIKQVDPKITRAEEEKQNDFLAPDREAARSGNQVAFMHDYEKAALLAKDQGKRLLIDFETTWCGPCKTMDKWVYTADAVIEESKSLICVKVDGDERKDLVENYTITGYPTLLVLDKNGDEQKRATGYQSVLKTIALMKN